MNINCDTLACDNVIHSLCTGDEDSRKADQIPGGNLNVNMPYRQSELKKVSCSTRPKIPFIINTCEHGRGDGWWKASAFFRRLVTEGEKPGNMIWHPVGARYYEIHITTGPLWGEWLLGYKKTAWKRIEALTICPRVAAGTKISPRGWNAAMRTNKDLAFRYLEYYNHMDAHQISTRWEENYLHALGLLDQYEALDEIKRMRVREWMNCSWFHVLGYRRRELFLRRILVLKEKVAFRRTWPRMHPHVRNQLRTNNELAGHRWTRKLMTGLNKYGTQHLDIVNFMTMSRLGRDELNTMILRWMARNPGTDATDALRNYLTEYNGHEDFSTWTVAELIAAHNQAVVVRAAGWGRYRAQWNNTPEQQEFKNKMSELANSWWTQSLDEMDTDIDGIRLLRTKTDYEQEGTNMRHCVGSYYQYVHSYVTWNTDKTAKKVEIEINHCYHLEVDGETGTLMVQMDSDGLHQVQFYGPRNTRVSSAVVKLANKLATNKNWGIVIVAN